MVHSDGDADPLGWFSVRSLFRFGEHMYEERITLHRARDFDDAFDRATAAGRAYADDISTDDIPVVHLSTFGQGYALADDPTIDGAEVFSLIRDSGLHPDPYIDRFFDTGTERQGEG